MPYNEQQPYSWRDSRHPLHRLTKALKYGGLPTDAEIAAIPGGEQIKIQLVAAAREAQKHRDVGDRQGAWDVLDKALANLGPNIEGIPMPPPLEEPDLDLEARGERMFGYDN